MKRISRLAALLLALLLIPGGCQSAGSSRQDSQSGSGTGQILPLEGIDAENYPTVNGSTANHPLICRIYEEICGVSEEKAETMVNLDLGSTGSIGTQSLDVIRRNPFDFKLVDVVSNDSQKRSAMTEEQQTLWMDFIRKDKTYCKYYDEFVVLLGTGMRVSEFCGLTKADLDFAGRKIRVDHQLVRERGGKYYVEKTKTECGCRYIPMTDEVYRSLQNILSRRKRVKTETIIDGYSGFLLLDKNDSPKVALHIENEMRWAMKKYQKLHPDKPLPHITPHVFRHTFCTNMANAGMDIKTLQYVMGHSDVGVTLNVYTHASYDRAAEQMAKIIDFKGLAAPEPQRKSG